MPRNPSTDRGGFPLYFCAARKFGTPRGNLPDAFLFFSLLDVFRGAELQPAFRRHSLGRRGLKLRATV